MSVFRSVLLLAARREVTLGSPRCPAPIHQPVVPDHRHGYGALWGGVLGAPSTNGWSSLENSIGNTYFVAGPAPRAFKASRYWRLIVLMSTVWATSKILPKASENPSARRIAAWRSPPAFRIADCFSPSAMVMAACFIPAASVTSALRPRPADICGVIASKTALGGE